MDYVLKHEKLIYRGKNVCENFVWIVFDVMHVSFQIVLTKGRYAISANLCIKIYENDSKILYDTVSVDKPEVMGLNQLIVKDYADENKGKWFEIKLEV